MTPDERKQVLRLLVNTRKYDRCKRGMFVETTEETQIRLLESLLLDALDRIETLEGKLK